jgi:DTW domain-containing protein
MREVLCVCTLAPRIELKTRVTVLMHWREVKTTSNSGRIAALALPNSEIRVRGGRDCPLPTEGLLPAGFQPLLLFPTSDSVELTRELVAEARKPIHLIVPDGTWRQARKTSTRESVFDGIPRVRLPSGQTPSSYQLRQTPHLENLSTLEAIARALEITDGPEVRAKLEQLFEIMVERVLWSRGKLQLSECKFPIPEAAIRAFYEDGCRGNPRPARLLT